MVVSIEIVEFGAFVTGVLGETGSLVIVVSTGMEEFGALVVVVSLRIEEFGASVTIMLKGLPEEDMDAFVCPSND